METKMVKERGLASIIPVRTVRTLKRKAVASLFLTGMLIGLCAPQLARATEGALLRANGDIAPAIAACRSLFGDPLNGATRDEQPAGRREINWDGVPAPFTNTDTFPGNFFNVNSPRGAIFTTPGSGFRVSDNDFSDINPSYQAQFDAFSPQKTFMPVNSNTLDVLFQVAGAGTAASVSGFCVVFSDVDIAGSARIELFQGSESLLVVDAPVHGAGSSLSLAGVILFDKRITRVRITSGEGALGAANNDLSDGGVSDLVIMDDFLYSEPRSDRDADGILDVSDLLARLSDTRNTVDVNGGTNASQTKTPNLTLRTGETIQDLVTSCQQAGGRLKNCLKAQLRRLKAARVLSRAEKKLIEEVISKARRL